MNFDKIAEIVASELRDNSLFYLGWRTEDLIRGVNKITDTVFEVNTLEGSLDVLVLNDKIRVLQFERD